MFYILGQVGGGLKMYVIGPHRSYVFLGEIDMHRVLDYVKVDNEVIFGFATSTFF